MDIAIVGIISLIALAGHVWIYRWVKFKVHEGVVLEILSNAPGRTGRTAEDIAAQAQLQDDRIIAICERSKQISASSSGHWQTNTTR